MGKFWAASFLSWCPSVTSVWRKWCDKHKVVGMVVVVGTVRGSCPKKPMTTRALLTSDLIWSVTPVPQNKGSPGATQLPLPLPRARDEAYSQAASQGLSRGKWFSYRRPPRARLSRATPPTRASLRHPWPACLPPPYPGWPAQLAQHAQRGRPVPCRPVPAQQRKKQKCAQCD